MVEVSVHTVTYDVFSGTPVVILRNEENKDEYLPIWIGYQEAVAIMVKLHDEELPRPLTVDIFKSLLDALEAEVVKAEITGFDGGIYLAHLVIKNKDGKEVIFDIRPSDLIAVALRAETPIMVSNQIMEEYKMMRSEEGTEETNVGGEDKLMNEFHEFLENVNPEDFNKN